VLKARLFNAYNYIFDNRRRKLPCDDNFFSRGFAARMESPGAHVIDWLPLKPLLIVFLRLRSRYSDR
jgi:hypothetical protein